MKNKFVLFFVLLFLIQNGGAQAQRPGMTEVDRIRLAEAFRIGRTLGNRIWKDWDKAPFAVLLVTPEREFLIRHPKPSAEFTSIGYDEILQSEIFYRKRVFSPNLLATFPAVSGIPTIVIGQVENTAKKNSSDWVVTVLHEHFHQLQNSQPVYFASVDALNLSGGDETGMWMLNYAFPYKQTEIKEQFKTLSRLMAKALQTENKKEFSNVVAGYLEERRKLEKTLAPADYKYFSFQMWQEGLARYTEYRVAELAARKYKPSREFKSLKDFKPFRKVADEMFQGIIRELTELELENYQRVAFYPLGAGEGLLLDKTNPKWRNRYFAEKFYIERYFN